MKNVRFTAIALVLLLMAGLTSFTASAQGKFQFTNELHDFGDIKEGTVAEHTFEFTNVGNAPIVISHVQASCGCTTPDWTKEPIAPGKKGFIKASYNSEGRPGAFYKTITITANADPTAPMLTIKGNAVGGAHEHSEVAASFSAISFDKVSHNFGKVQVGEKVSRTFTYTNTGSSDLSILAISSMCGCVTYKNGATTVKPGESAQIELIYSPTKVDTKEEIVHVQTNSVTQPQVNISLIGEVVGSLSGQSILKEKRGGF